MIKFGPAGLGGVKEAGANLEEYHRLGLKACEIAFTYGAYIKEKDAEAIGKKAKECGIALSIHAPYWINLNSDDSNKVKQSRQRILESCKIGELLGAKYVVFHPGYYGKTKKGETEEDLKKRTYDAIKNEISEIMSEIKKNKWKINIAPETTGRVNVFGSIDEILNLVEDTGCFFCIDFAHLLARSNGKLSYLEMYKKVKAFATLHCHFTGIAYGEKGEKHHTETSEIEIKKLLSAIEKNKNATIINESPMPVADSVKSADICGKI